MNLKKICNGAGDTFQLFHVQALQFCFNPATVQETQEPTEPEVMPLLFGKMAGCATNTQHLVGLEQVAFTTQYLNLFICTMKVTTYLLRSLLAFKMDS